MSGDFSEGLEYELNSDGKGYTVSGKGTCEDNILIIPPTYNGLPVTAIGKRAFANHTEIMQFSIPDSVTRIEYGAFYGCYGLISIIIPSGVKSIDPFAFADCSAVTSIYVETGNTVYYAKDNCLIEIATKTLVVGCNNSVIPDDVTSIGNYAFSARAAITDITIPDGVQSIGTAAFYGCGSLTSITIPSSITSIGNSAFADCINIKTITFIGTEEQWNAITKGANWDYGVGSNTSSGKYELAYGGSDPEPPVTTTTTATTTTTTTTTEMVTTTLPMFARFDFGTDTTAQDDGQTSHEWLKNNLSYNESYIKVEFFEDSWKIYALKTYVSGTTPTDAYAVVFQNIADVEYEDLVPGWGTWSRYPVNTTYVGTSWEGKHQYMKIRIKNNTENNMISFGFKGNNNKFATTYCVSNMYMQGGDDKLTCTPSDEWAVYYYDVPKCCQVASYAYGAGRNNNTDIGVATSFTQWVELYGPTGAYNGLNWSTVGGPCGGLKFNLLGAEKYHSKVPTWCDSRANIKKGATVEVDYIFFGSTIDQLEACKSKMELAAK